MTRLYVVMLRVERIKQALLPRRFDSFLNQGHTDSLLQIGTALAYRFAPGFTT
jgi:hypothetical protein